MVDKDSDHSNEPASRSNGDIPESTSDLVSRLYPELKIRAARHMRRERRGHTLDATALVHEVFLKFAKTESRWERRCQFLNEAGAAMRRVLVDHARKRRRAKRGGLAERITLTESIAILPEGTPLDVIALDDALSKLSGEEPRAVRVVEMCFFAGATHEEAAEALNVSARTVRNDWMHARAWLARELERGGHE